MFTFDVFWNSLGSSNFGKSRLATNNTRYRLLSKLSFCYLWKCLNVKLRGLVSYNVEVIVNFLVRLLFGCLELVNRCHDGEIKYIPGENYTKGNCTQNCSCSEVRYAGHVEQCVPLCPSTPVKCLLGYIPELDQKNIEGSECSWRKWRCVKGLLKYLFIFAMWQW